MNLHADDCCLRTVRLDVPNHTGRCMARRDFDCCAYQYEDTDIVCNMPRFHHATITNPKCHRFVEPANLERKL